MFNCANNWINPWKDCDLGSVLSCEWPFAVFTYVHGAFYMLSPGLKLVLNGFLTVHFTSSYTFLRPSQLQQTRLHRLSTSNVRLPVSTGKHPVSSAKQSWATLIVWDTDMKGFGKCSLLKSLRWLTLPVMPFRKIFTVMRDERSTVVQWDCFVYQIRIKIVFNHNVLHQTQYCISIEIPLKCQA